MITAVLQVIGTGHRARFGEEFDARLGEVIGGAVDPVRAAAELDELTLLVVLSHVVAAGRYDPATPGVAWGLEVDVADRRIRLHRHVIHYSADLIEVVTFRIITITPEHSIVADVDAVTIR